MPNHKILKEICPLALIKEVQKWPVLYDKDNPERTNFNFRNKVWPQVAKSLFPDWEHFSEHEQDIKVREVMKKWRNLRDTFRKHAAGAADGRRRYVYARHMSFLLPHERASPTPARPAAARPRRPAPSPAPAAPPSPPAPRPAERLDEDEHFLLSLVPSFRKMTDDQKLTAKMEILRVIQQVRSSGIEFRSAGVHGGGGEGGGGGRAVDVKLELETEEEGSRSSSEWEPRSPCDPVT